MQPAFRRLDVCVLFVALSIPGSVCAGLFGGTSPPPILSVDWKSFLGRHDLIWEQLPRQWNEGAFVGNGQLGLMAYANLADNRFDFHLGRVDVTDHRRAPERKTSRGIPGAGVLYDFARLDLGRILLRPAGKIKDGTLRMDLWNAEITGTIVTDLGELRVRAATLHDRMVNVISVVSTEKTADGKAAAWRWEFLPGYSSTPRKLVRPEENPNYELNPAPGITTLDGVPVCVQSLLAGGDYATAWLDRPAPDGRSTTLYVTTANEVPAAGRSAPAAVADLHAAAALPEDRLFAGHRSWWHEYYPRSFVTIPEPRLESFYWIQLYKIASASRPDAPPLDNLGPFFRINQWPGLWWNLNVQITYWPVYTGNHLELGTNLIDEIDANFDGLFAGFAKGPKLGDLAWVLHNYWLHHRYLGDWTAIHKGWTPKAKAVLADYLPRLRPNSAGRLDLAPMGSPEFKGFAVFENTNYNLALLRWLLSSLIEADEHTGLAPDEALPEWRRVLAALVDYPTDANGLMIGSNQSVDHSHRHFSHLIALYPLFQLSPDSPTDRELVLKSLRHWHQVGKGKRLAGYSFTGGAALNAALGLGDEALAMLNTFLDGKGGAGMGILLPNTFYAEVGGKNPVLETPHTVASATQELLLQSWGGKIRVFPAVPTSWPEARFHAMRAEGGFVVSAAREQGRTAWIAVRSEAGEPCVLKVPDWAAPPEVLGARQRAITEVGKGEYRLDLRRGEQVTLFPAGHRPEFLVAPLPIHPEQANPYGVKRGRELTTDQTWPEVKISGEKPSSSLPSHELSLPR